MDVIRHMTMIHPVNTFLYGAEWLLQRAAQTPAADVQRMLLCNKIYNLYTRPRSQG